MCRRYKFTLADDDDKFLFLMHHLLLIGFPGSSIASFSSAEDALKYVLHSETDLVITDHTMGAMTGTGLIRELRNQRFVIPIIMVSGDEGAEEEAVTAGADEFLHKNHVYKYLVPRIRKYLAEPS